MRSCHNWLYASQNIFHCLFAALLLDKVVTSSFFQLRLLREHKRKEKPLDFNFTPIKTSGCTGTRLPDYPPRKWITRAYPNMIFVFRVIPEHYPNLTKLPAVTRNMNFLEISTKPFHSQFMNENIISLCMYILPWKLKIKPLPSKIFQANWNIWLKNEF